MITSYLVGSYYTKGASSQNIIFNRGAPNGKGGDKTRDWDEGKEASEMWGWNYGLAYEAAPRLAKLILEPGVRTTHAGGYPGIGGAESNRGTKSGSKERGKEHARRRDAV